jgi:hypothetical protein
MALAAYETFAIAFATALVERDFHRAAAMLGQPQIGVISADDIKQRYESMCGATVPDQQDKIAFDPEFSLTEWSAKQVGDVGWAYVSILTDGRAEAVAVVVATKDDQLFVRQIEWGRP